MKKRNEGPVRDSLDLIMIIMMMIMMMTMMTMKRSRKEPFSLGGV